jgi:hypothetical protein
MIGVSRPEAGRPWLTFRLPTGGVPAGTVFPDGPGAGLDYSVEPKSGLFAETSCGFTVMAPPVGKEMDWTHLARLLSELPDSLRDNLVKAVRSFGEQVNSLPVGKMVCEMLHIYQLEDFYTLAVVMYRATRRHVFGVQPSGQEALNAFAAWWARQVEELPDEDDAEAFLQLAMFHQEMLRRTVVQD